MGLEDNGEVYMPVYEYECKNCNTRFDKLQSITSEALTVCENCGGGPIRRVFQPVGIIFKGSGWYATDNRKSNAASSDSSSSGDSDRKASGESGSKSEDTASKATKDNATPSGPSAGSD